MSNRSGSGRLFRSCGLRYTPQRKAVLQHVLNHPLHVTAEEVFQALNRRDPKASRATVYNALNALVGAGLIRHVAVDGRAARFDGNTAAHHHFHCESCGGLEDVPWFDVPLPDTPEAGGRKVNRYQIVFSGLCATCCRKGHPIEV